METLAYTTSFLAAIALFAYLMANKKGRTIKRIFINVLGVIIALLLANKGLDLIYEDGSVLGFLGILGFVALAFVLILTQKDKSSLHKGISHD